MMKIVKIDTKSIKKIVSGYEIIEACIFEDNKGFVFGKNPNAISPFASWQFTENENGERDYFGGHSFSNYKEAKNDFVHRIYQHII